VPEVREREENLIADIVEIGGGCEVCISSFVERVGAGGSGGGGEDVVGGVKEVEEDSKLKGGGGSALASGESVDSNGIVE
jgi:hypothetical protein